MLSNFLSDPDQGVQYQMDLQNPGVMIYYEEQLNDREAVNVTINPMSNFKGLLRFFCTQIKILLDRRWVTFFIKSKKS